MVVVAFCCAAMSAYAGSLSNPSRPTKEEPKRESDDSGKDEETMSFDWPVGGRKIMQGYGERVNPLTNTVTLNPGINIAATKGSTVKAAAEGVVTLVSWLPGFGTIVIIRHDDGYRTVYANLSSSIVARGKRVRVGQKIGSVGQSRDGTFLHFEVWRDKTRHDPLSLLK